ncbi:MAG TPA: Nramp family divalent metal transporter [Pelobium sp.]|nr:Nramp family divalent metal transporter [Pelobium sp.]
MKPHKPKKRFWKLLSILGPGLTTGAADDDPSGIATYSQTGAQFGYKQLWTALYMLPFMIAVQEACSRIGLVTGKGLAAIIKDHYSKKTLYMVVGIVVLANTINIGADIGAMAAAAGLLIPLPFAVLTLLFTAIILILEIFTSYRTYSKILKWLALSLLAYPITVAIIEQPWQTIFYASIIPKVEFSFSFLFIIVGVFGTTISPYMFFWQTSQEVEEEKERRIVKPAGTDSLLKHIKVMRIDNGIGMVISEFTTWCILVVAASTLHDKGITDIRTAADAAKALEPLVSTFPYAGLLAKIIFSIGIIGLGLLAVPILSGSAAYAVAETFRWNSGLNQKLKKAHGFYGVITIATLIGLVINFVGIDPVKALIYAAVLNGIATVPLLYIIAKIAASKEIMGVYKSQRLSKLFVWLTFAAMSIAVIGLILISINYEEYH